MKKIPPEEMVHYFNAAFKTAASFNLCPLLGKILFRKGRGWTVSHLVVLIFQGHLLLLNSLISRKR